MDQLVIVIKEGLIVICMYFPNANTITVNKCNYLPLPKELEDILPMDEE